MPTALRSRIKAKRSSLSKAQQKLAALRLLKHCSQYRIYKKATHVAVYLSHRGEIDLTPLIQHAWRNQKQLYLPLVHQGKLLFQPYQKHTPLIKNQYGIKQPIPQRKSWPLKKLELTWTPLVAFDAKRNRLGSGKGYYDKSFNHKLKLGGVKPKLAGVAYAWQQHPQLESQPWDVAMDRLFTERNGY